MSHTFQDFVTLLTNQITNPNDNNYNIEDETLHEFHGFPQMEIGYNGDDEHFGIYLSFSGITDIKFSTDLFENWTQLIKPLKDYLILLFSENTNNDACSFNIDFDTNHLDITDESLWEIKISVTDYYS